MNLDNARVIDSYLPALIIIVVELVDNGFYACPLCIELIRAYLACDELIAAPCLLELVFSLM
jgi:hypothetical protein